MHAPSDNLDEATVIPAPNSLPTDSQLENPETAALLGSVDSGKYQHCRSRSLAISHGQHTFPQKTKVKSGI